MKINMILQYLERTPHQSILVEMESGVVVLVAGGKPESQEKNPRSKAATNKLKPHMRPTGILPGSHRWEASALATAPSRIPK